MPRKHAHPLNKLSYQDSNGIATLAARTGILGLARILLQDFVGVSLQGSAAIPGLTVGDGPLIFGICSADFTLVQIEQFLETVQLRKAETFSEEVMARGIQILGSVGDDRQSIWLDMIKLRIPTFQEDVGFRTFVYNASNQAFSTGAVFETQFLIFGRWLN